MYICGLFAWHMAGDTKCLSSKWAQLVWQSLLLRCSLHDCSSKPCHPTIRMLNSPCGEGLEGFKDKFWLSSLLICVLGTVLLKTQTQTSDCTCALSQHGSIFSQPIKRDFIPDEEDWATGVLFCQCSRVFLLMVNNILKKTNYEKFLLSLLFSLSNLIFL